MKHPVTKQKKSASRAKKQYFVFADGARKKLRNMAPLVICSNCKEKKINHTICKNCGFYADNAVKKMASPLDTVTKIKA